MASPPTVTGAQSSQPSGLTQASLWSDVTPPFNYVGGVPVTISATYKFFTPATIFSTGGNLGLNNGQNSIAWRVHATINSARFAVRLRGSAGILYRFIVDGQYVDMTGTEAGTGGAQFYVELDFTSVGGKVSRSIVVEGMANDGFVGFYTAVGDTITKPTVGYLANPLIQRCIFVGDSYTACTGATHAGDGFPFVAGELIGCNDIWPSGVGGSGFVATNAGAAYNLPQRLFDVTANSPDFIVLAMGLNDLAFSALETQSKAALVLSAFRKACPTAPIFVVGPWDVNAPAAPAANHALTRDAIQRVCSYKKGVWFLDPTGVVFAQSAAHPTTAGHATLGAWLNTTIRAAIA